MAQKSQLVYRKKDFLSRFYGSILVIFQRVLSLIWSIYWDLMLSKRNRHSINTSRQLPTSPPISQQNAFD